MVAQQITTIQKAQQQRVGNKPSRPHTTPFSSSGTSIHFFSLPQGLPSTLLSASGASVYSFVCLGGFHLLLSASGGFRLLFCLPQGLPSTLLSASGASVHSFVFLRDFRPLFSASGAYAHFSLPQGLLSTFLFLRGFHPLFSSSVTSVRLGVIMSKIQGAFFPLVVLG